MAILGLDAGGTKILVGVVENGNILCSKRYLMDRSTLDRFLQSIFGSLEDFVQSIKGADLPKIEGIGIGTTGHIDYNRGTVVSYAPVSDAEEVPVREILEPKYGLPVRIDNDVHCASLGEYFYGQGKDCQSMLYVNIGTGIASSIIEDGHLIRGFANAACESGYFHMNLDGDPNEDDQVEMVASGGGLIQEAKRRLPGFPDSVLHRNLAEGTLHAGTIFDAAQAGDPLALQISDRAAKYIGAWLAGMLGTLNPERVIFGGGVVKNKWFFEKMTEAVDRYTFVPQAWHGLRYFGVTKLNSDQIGLIGASSLFLLP